MEEALQHPLILEKIRRSKTWHDPISGRIYMYIDLTKKELQQLDNSTLALLEGYVDRFITFTSTTPGSIREFLTDDKYPETGYVVLGIPVSDLLDTGILSKKKIGNLTYWVLQGEVLDPGQHGVLYASSIDTIATLLYRKGLGEVYEKYRDRIRINPSYVCELRFNDILVRIHYDNMLEATTCHDIEGYPDITCMVEVSATTSNPKPRDIEKTVEYIEYTRYMINEIVYNIINYIGDLEESFQNIYVAGQVHVFNYRLRKLDIEVVVEQNLTDDVGRLVEITVWKDDTSPPLTDVTLEHTRLLHFHLKPPRIPETLLPYGFYTVLGTHRITLRYRAMVEGAMPPSININKYYTVIKKAEPFLLSILDKYIETSQQAREIARVLNWRRGDDRDSTLLKLALLRIMYPRDEVRRIFMLYTVLKGYIRDTERINRNPYTVLLELVHEGKLDIREANGKPIILFKGKNIREVIPVLPKNLEEELLRILSLKIPRRELVELRRKLCTH